MREPIQFALLGISLGAVYALLGQGIVVIYRGSGVLNLAHGGYATVAAFLFIKLHAPASFGTTGASGWPFLPAFLVAVGAAVALGVITDRLILHRLRSASSLVRLIATLGVLLVIEAATVKIYGTYQPFVPSVLPSHLLHLGGGLVLDVSSLWLLGIAVVLTAVLTVVWRSTRLGWAATGVAESQRAAASVGISPARVSAATWALGAGLAGVAGILIAPITQVTSSNLSLTVIAALAAVLLGGFESFPATLLSGLFVGIAQSVVSSYQPFFASHLHVTSASDALPLLVIVLVLVVRGSSVPLRGHLSDRLPALGTGAISWGPAAAASVLVTAFMLVVAGNSVLLALATSFAVATILLSVVVLTGYAGQLSLAQYAVAGGGGLIAAKLSSAAGFPFVAAAVAGILGAVAVGVIFAGPALRTRGVSLAVVTLAFGWAMEDMVFSNPDASGETAGVNLGNPTLFGWSVAPGAHLVRYAVMVFVVFVICAVLVAVLRRGRLGRRMVALRANERAAAAVGVSIFRTKLVAFAVAGALAGVGGVLLSFEYQNAVFTSYDPFSSLLAISEVVIGGIGFVLGPIAGAIVAPGALLSLVGLHWQGFEGWLPLIGGVLMLVTVMLNPDGIVGEHVRLLRARGFGDRRRRAEEARDQELLAAAPNDDSDLEEGRVTPRSLVVSGLTVRYGGVVAVDDLSLTVSPGDVVGLIGPNGAGKTSVMDAVSGFTRCSGTVRLDDVAIDGWTPSRRASAGLGRSFQGLELFHDLSVLENLLVAQDHGERMAAPARTDRERARRFTATTIDAIREFRLAGRLQAMPDQLSYGERRLVAIARAVAARPSVLLLDEPVSGLSDAESEELARLVRRLADVWGVGVLVIEHDMAFVMAIADRVTVMDFGRQVCEGAPEEVRRDPAAIRAYLGSETDEKLPAGEVVG